MKADKKYGNIRADNDDGFRLTAHYQYYNHLAPEKERIYPFTLLQDYHNRYPTLKYMTHYDKEDFTCTRWFIPSASEFLKLNLNHLNSLENSLFNPLRKELGLRMEYLGGFNENFYWFWTSCISKDKEHEGYHDYSKAVGGGWTIGEKAGTEDIKKSIVRDVLPFFKF